MKRWSWILAVALVLPFLAQPAQAQVSFGPQLAWGDATDLGIGARAEFGLGEAFGFTESPFAELYGSATATYFFWDCGGGFGPGGADLDCNYIELNANGAIPFEIDAGVTPFVGAGLHLGRTSVSSSGFSDSDTEVGLNILGGLQFPLGGYGGFVEGKFGLTGADQFVLSTGILF